MFNQNILINDLPCRYSKYSNPSSEETLIFLLGALQTIEDVVFFSQYFSKFATVYTVELPGTGENPPLSSEFSINFQANILNKFINDQDIGNLHLACCSYGTAVSLEILSLRQDIKSLSIFGGAPGIPISGLRSTIFMMADALREQERFSNTFTDSLSDPTTKKHRSVKRLLSRTTKDLSESKRESFFENSMRLLKYIPSLPLSDINIPCSVIVGELDPYVSIKDAKELSDKIPNSQFSVIEGCDHFAHLEAPEETAKRLSDLVRIAYLENSVSTSVFQSVGT